MAVIVVGGQCSKVGKTAVVCALIAAMPGRRWTAIKISCHGHDLNAPLFSIEQGASDTTDTGRYLAAGAERAILISGSIADELPRLWDEIAAAEMMLIESNRILEFIEPDIFLLVVDPNRSDFKESARRWLETSDALLIRSGVRDDLAPGIPRFSIAPGDWAPIALITSLEKKLTAL